jgi:hypothetical protein
MPILQKTLKQLQHLQGQKNIGQSIPHHKTNNQGCG